MRGLKKTSQCTSAPAWGARGGAGSEAKGKSVPTRPRCQAGWEQAKRGRASLPRAMCTREWRDRRWAPTRRKAAQVECRRERARDETLRHLGGRPSEGGSRSTEEGAPDSLHCNSQREPLSRERRPLVSWVSEQKPDWVQREMAGVSNQVGVSAR